MAIGSSTASTAPAKADPKHRDELRVCSCKNSQGAGVRESKARCREKTLDLCRHDRTDPRDLGAGDGGGGAQRRCGPSRKSRDCSAGGSTCLDDSPPSGGRRVCSLDALDASSRVETCQKLGHLCLPYNHLQHSVKYMQSKKLVCGKVDYSCRFIQSGLLAEFCCCETKAAVQLPRDRHQLITHMKYSPQGHVHHRVSNFIRIIVPHTSVHTRQPVHLF